MGDGERDRPAVATIVAVIQVSGAELDVPAAIGKFDPEDRHVAAMPTGARPVEAAVLNRNVGSGSDRGVAHAERAFARASIIKNCAAR